MRSLALTALALGLSAPLSAQTVETFPNTLPTSFAGNSWPFNNTTAAGFRTQFIYDGSQMITHKGPILIQRIRMRRSSGSTTATQYNVTISLSTSPTKWNALTTTFANHVGKDAQVIHQGTLNYNSSLWYCDIQLKTPFLYDASQGDLCFDFVRGAPGSNTNTYPGAGGYTTGSATAPFPANRIWGAPTAATGSLDSGTTAQYGYANTAEITYVPASGLYSNFSADKVEGKSPLTVKFTDKTYTSDKGGVTSWAWDFDNDNTIDSTAQNPTHVFTGKGYDVKYTVSLTTTDATHKPSKITKPNFITVNPFPVAATESFGQGSTNKPVNGPIDPGAYLRAYNASATRGFYFQAPTSFVITGFKVPNEASQPQQAVACMFLPNKPPAFSNTYTVVKNDVQFFAAGAKADTILTAIPPIVVKKDQWIGILGAGQAASGTTMYNSYGNVAVSSSVLGQPVTLNRFIKQATLVGGDGTGPVSSEDAGSIARVEVYVAGNTTVPLLTSEGQPYFGNSAKVTLEPKIQGIQVGLLLLSLSKLPTQVPTPFGNLLINPGFVITIPVPNGMGSATLPIPNDKNFADAHLYWQGAVFDLTNGVYGMSNGQDWLLGQQ